MFGFPYDARLHLQREFDSVFESGKSLRHKGIVLWWKPCARVPEKENVRIGIIVSKKLGPAHQRNRAKRLIREVFRLNRHKIEGGALLLISPRTSECLANLHTAEEAVLELWHRAKLI